jgi:hypothetical protein
MLYNPDLKDLCVSGEGLRENILHRVAAIGCRLGEEDLADAEAIVAAKIGEFLFGAKYETTRRGLVGRHGRDDRAMTLLVLECATAIDARRPQTELPL